MAAPKICFVTVGTTSFDAFIQATNDAAFRKLLVERFGITELRIQYGRGAVKPELTRIQGLSKVEAFDFKPTLAEEMAAASLIISHAGAGSIMEALRLKKPLIVVVNDALMDNHQIEVASALQRGNYLAFAHSPEDLRQVLATVSIETFDTYPDRDTTAFASMLDDEMGFQKG